MKSFVHAFWVTTIKKLQTLPPLILFLRSYSFYASIIQFFFSPYQTYIESENKRLERDPSRCFDAREINVRMEYRFCPNMIVIDTPGMLHPPKVSDSSLRLSVYLLFSPRLSLSCTVLHCTVLSCAVLYCPVLFSSVLPFYAFFLFFTTVRYTELYCTIIILAFLSYFIDFTPHQYFLLSYTTPPPPPPPSPLPYRILTLLVPQGRQLTPQQRALAQASREAESLVLSKIRCQDYIILCVEDTTDWKHATTRYVSI